MHRKAARLVRKHSRLSTVIAATVAAAGFGAVGAASAAATPDTSAANGAAGLQHGQPVSGLRLDAREVPAPGLIGALSYAVAAVNAHSSNAQQTHPAPAAPAVSKPAPAHAAPAKPAPAKPAPPKPAPPKPAPPKPAPVHAAPPKPFLLYDSVSPRAIPHGPQVATYVNGSYAASASDVAGRGHVLWIDTNGSDTHADVLDVEPGDATPAGAASWVQARVNADHNAIAIVYTMQSEWQAVKDNVAALPRWVQSHVRYWIADPTGVPHVVPGSNATQWYWGKSYDITTANPGFES